MDLRKNRKGMVAIVDALIFISILSIAAFGFFVFSESSETEVPMAESVANDLFSMELRACDVCDTADTTVYPISMLIAVNMVSGDMSSMAEFLKDTLDWLIPGIYGYSLIIDYHGEMMDIERHGHDEMNSSYSSTEYFAEDECLTYELTIFG